MQLLRSFLPLALLALIASCGDGSGSTPASAKAASQSDGGTFRIEITGDETRTLTQETARASVSRITRDDPPILSFRVLEPDGEGYMLYQLMISLSDVQPGEYVFDYETDAYGYAVDEAAVQLSIAYTVMEADANQAMVMGGRGEQYNWGQSGTLTLNRLAEERLDGEFDVTVHSTRMPGLDRKSIRATGEFSGVSIARR